MNKLVDWILKNVVPILLVMLLLALVGSIFAPIFIRAARDCWAFALA